MATKQEMLAKLRDAEKAGVDLSSPKAVVTHMLQQGDKETILSFYKPGTVEFDFDRYRKLVGELKVN